MKLSRIGAAATGLCVGVAVGLLLLAGNLAAIVAVGPVSLVLLGVVWLLVPPEHRWKLAALVALAFAVRLAATAVMHEGALAAGLGGFIPGDDRDYAEVAWQVARYWAGDPEAQAIAAQRWLGRDYLLGTYLYLQAAVFWVVGPNVPLFLVFNAAFAAATVALIYDMGRRLFDHRAGLLAAAIVAFYPSLVAWSSLNLKDALTLLIVALVFWSVARFHERARWWPMLLPLALLIPMESLRPHMIAGLAMIVPLGVALAPRLTLMARLGWTAAASALFAAVGVLWAGYLPLAIALALIVPLGLLLAPRLSLRARLGGIIAATALCAAAITSLAAVGALENVPSLDTNMLSRLEEMRYSMTIGARTAYADTPPWISPAPGVPAPDLDADRGLAGSLARTLEYLPNGLAHALFAPFPWAIERELDLLTVPEMLLWYLVVVSVPVAMFVHRRSWRTWAPIAVYVIGLLLVMTLVQGNVGTLFRSRAMVIPFAVLLAAPGMLLLAQSVRSRAVSQPAVAAGRLGPRITGRLLRRSVKVYLVTGGAGFIGSHLVEHLVGAGRKVRVVDDLSTGDLSRLAPYRKRIEFVRADLATADLAPLMRGVGRVFHLAAVPSVPRSVKDPLTTHASIATATLRLLVAAREAGVSRVVLSSSSSVYGEAAASPKHEGLSPAPLSPYAVAKATTEAYARVFAALYGLHVVSLRYFNVFGPRQDPRSDYAAVIPRFVSRALAGQPLQVHGDGSQTRDFTYVANVVAANLAAATADVPAGSVFNIAAGEPRSLHELIAALEEICGTRLSVQYGPPRPGDVLHSHADISAAEAGLGWSPEVSFAEGLRRTVLWFRRR